MPKPTVAPFRLRLAAPDLTAAPPVTVAEKTDYKATSRHADVVAFCKQLAKESPLVRLGELGTSHEGRKLPLLILADPPVATPAEAAQSGKLVVFAIGNIHAGEVDGKEALLMLARDLAAGEGAAAAQGPRRRLRARSSTPTATRRSASNRPDRTGPRRGRHPRQRPGLRPQPRLRQARKPRGPRPGALPQPVGPGRRHRLPHDQRLATTATRSPTTAAAAPPATPQLIDFTPRRAAAGGDASGWRSRPATIVFYGNFAPDRASWETYLPTPRYGTQYVGLRNRIGILSESYVYAPFKDRVLATDGVRAAHPASTPPRTARRSRKLLTDAREAEPAGQGRPAVQGRRRRAGRATILGFVEEMKDGKRVSTGKPKTYEVDLHGRHEPTLSVTRPYAYLVPAALDEGRREPAAARHRGRGAARGHRAGRRGLPRREDHAGSADFQKHQPVTLEVTPRKETPARAGGHARWSAPASRSGSLAVFLLEPQSMTGWRRGTSSTRR